MIDLKINNLYGFNTLAPAVLQARYDNMKLIGKVAANIAAQYRDITTLHNNLLSIIPNLPLAINDLEYLLFKTVDNESVIIALEYIDPNSIQKVTSTNIRIEIYNATDVDISNIKLRLAEIGYTNANITTFDL